MKCKMKMSAALALLLGASGPMPVRAGIITYSSQAAFDAAAPPVATQTFAAAHGTGAMSNTLNSSTNNTIFNTGDILAGLSIAATGNHPGQDLFISTFGGITNKAVVANFGVESLNLSFFPGVTAVSLGLLSENLSSSTFTVSVFDPSNVLIGTATVSNVPNAGSGQFFGVTTTDGDVIGRINLNSPTNRLEGVDRVQFGSTAPAPEPTSLTLLGMATATLAGYAGWRRRKPTLRV